MSYGTNKCVSFRLGRPDHLVQGDVGAIVPQPIDAAWFATLGYDTDASLGGHENNAGLNNNDLLKLMRSGLLLDIAHMDEKSATGALTLAEQFGYPIMDSHTGLRDDSNCPASVPPGTNERSLPFSQVTRIAKLGGVLGLATAKNQGPDAVEDWLNDLSCRAQTDEGKKCRVGH